MLQLSGVADGQKSPPLTSRKRAGSRGSASSAAAAANSVAAASAQKAKAGALVKKGGHGRGNWGKIGSEIEWNLKDSTADPNFDEESLIPCDRIAMVETVFSITPDEMKDFLQSPLEEFFVNGNVAELLGPFSEIATPKLNPQIVALLVEEGCERNNPDRELVSKLLLGFATAAGSWHASAEDICRGLDMALDRLDDLVLDTPDADHIIAKFIARAIGDEIIAPAYVLGFDYGLSAPRLVRRAMKKAAALVKTPQGLSRLEFVWGVSGARSPVGDLRSRINMLLREYLDTESIEEASICIREMEAVRFHHEVVRQIVQMSIESGDMKVMQPMVSLLQAVTGSSLISDHQLTMGFDRVLAAMEDICLDTPLAEQSFASFCRLAAPFLPEGLQRNIHLEAQKDGRKRTVSVTAPMPPLQR